MEIFGANTVLILILMIITDFSDYHHQNGKIKLFQFIHSLFEITQ